MAVNVNDPNIAKRSRAAKRSENQRAGKPIEEGIDDAPAVEDASPETEPEKTEAPEMPEVVAEAESEPEAAKEPDMAETPEEEAAEPPAEEAGETMAEEAAEVMDEEPAPETMVEEEAAEEPMAESAESNEYSPPEGKTHDELVNEYHIAIAYGDVEAANELYRQLQNHRYMENGHRGKMEAAAQKEWDDYVAVATSIVDKHPELNEKGLPADKVMALAELYRNNGESATSALKMAVADLYPEQPPAPEAVAQAAESPLITEAEMPAEEPEPAPAEEPEAAPAEEPEAAPAEAEVPPGGVDAGALIPEGLMEDRMARKSRLSVVPNASARNQPPPPPETPSRESAIAEMKRSRGQL